MLETSEKSFRFLFGSTRPLVRNRSLGPAQKRLLRHESPPCGEASYDGVTYRRIAPHITGGITGINGTRVTTLERTVIDSINLFEKIGGLEELLRCLALIPALEEAVLSACLAEYESGFLYQKTGYILSAFAGSLGLSERFSAMCKTHLPKGKSYTLLTFSKMRI